jgi:hypothetical protein
MEPITEDTLLSRSPRGLHSASRVQYLNRTDEISPTPTNSRVDWTSLRFNKRQRADAKKWLQFEFRTLLLGWMINNAAAISWPVAELMTYKLLSGAAMMRTVANYCGMIRCIVRTACRKRPAAQDGLQRRSRREEPVWTQAICKGKTGPRHVGAPKRTLIWRPGQAKSVVFLQTDII